MPESDADKLAVLVQCDTEWHAESIAGGLRGRGIAAQAEGGYVAGFRADVPAKARVLVFTKDLLQARLMLSELRTEAGSIDWDTVDVGPHVEGLPEPVARIGPERSDSQIAAAKRTRAMLATVAIALAGVVLLIVARLVRQPRY